MRRYLSAAGFTFLAAAICLAQATQPTTSPAGASGDWKWTFNIQGGQSIDQTAKLKEDGGKITGTFTDGYDKATFEIKDGKLAGDIVSFTVTRPVNDASITLNFNGKLADDVIKGKLEAKFGDQPLNMDWDAKRVIDEKPTTKPS